MSNAFQKQVGGDHYKRMAIQPVEYIHRNGLGFIQGCVVRIAKILFPELRKRK